jgi:16S rRNA G1207 methylase RsmC
MSTEQYRNTLQKRKLYRTLILKYFKEYEKVNTDSNRDAAMVTWCLEHTEREATLMALKSALRIMGRITGGTIQDQITTEMESIAKETKKKNTHKVYVVWGDTPMAKSEYEFDTIEEKNAFIYGINEADGYFSGLIIEDKKIWEDYKLAT